MPALPNPYCIVLTTAPDQATADKLADAMVTNRMAACVNIIAQVSSRYIWEGKLEKAQEFLLLIKTRGTLVPNLARFVKENHSYKVPEIVVLPIVDGERTYLDWLGASTQFSVSKPPELA